MTITYTDLGDIKSTDLISFAYQIASGMVSLLCQPLQTINCSKQFNIISVCVVLLHMLSQFLLLVT